VRAARDAGADAIYIGLRGMSARPAFAEMDLESAREARRITKDAGIELYLAFNRGIPAGSEDKWRAMIEAAVELAPDAIIVASWCVFGLLKEMGVDLPLHGGSFIGTHNAAGARRLRDLGFSRVIFPTSLFIDEQVDIIRRVRELEYEVFAYGYICLSDGARCALPHDIPTRKEKKYYYCHNRVVVVDREGKPVTNGRVLGYPLINLATMIGLYHRAGIRHFKIAGRERSAQFVHRAVTDLKQGIKAAIEWEASPQERFIHLLAPGLRKVPDGL